MRLGKSEKSVEVVMILSKPEKSAHFVDTDPQHTGITFH